MSFSSVICRNIKFQYIKRHKKGENLQLLGSDSQFRHRLEKLCLPAWRPFNRWPRCSQASLHHGQVFESVAPLLLGLVPGPQELDLPLLGLDLVPVLFQLLLGGHVRVGHRLEQRKRVPSSLSARRVRASFVPP